MRRPGKLEELRTRGKVSLYGECVSKHATGRAWCNVAIHHNTPLPGCRGMIQGGEGLQAHLLLWGGGGSSNPFDRSYRNNSGTNTTSALQTLFIFQYNGHDYTAFLTINGIYRKIFLSGHRVGIK